MLEPLVEIKSYAQVKPRNSRAMGMQEEPGPLTQQELLPLTLHPV